MPVGQQLPAGLAAAVPSHRRVAIAMDTLVTLEVVSSQPAALVESALQRALAWFGCVERACSRFDEQSEVRQLLRQVGQPVVVSPLVFEATRFALALARQSGGAFDPTVGQLLEVRGFNRHYRSGERLATESSGGGRVSYRDLRLDAARRTITLLRPLALDLGAVAKGLAIDLAARELAIFEDFCVEAGGDLYAKGHSGRGEPWRIGIQHPRAADILTQVLAVSQGAVCSSGDYERRSADGLEHHLVDPRSGRSAHALAGVTVVAPTAMAADGLATAAFILGPERGLRLLEREGVAGLLITPDGELRATRGLHEVTR
jgi:thiamine biosynthesis lipoprotein